jgi:lysosomal alpha-mannosidase
MKQPPITSPSSTNLLGDLGKATDQNKDDSLQLVNRILDDTVGECGRPKVGWQIDPFGHSREHASISKQLGFEGLVLGRIDYRDKSTRIEDKNLDFNWVTNPNFEDSTILTTMFPDFYTWPEGLCLDSTCASSQKLINDDNVEAVVSIKCLL